MKTKTRIAIFTNKGYIWAFPVWKEAIPRLLPNYEIMGLYLFPEKLGKQQDDQVKWWYQRTFGWINFILLGLYAVKTRLGQLRSPVRTWQGLAAAYQIPLLESPSPNALEVVEWVKAQEVDILVIMFGHILKPAILGAPRLGAINKHASLLPSGGGVFPYFWAKLKGLPTGVTIHKVEEDIDSGAILAQCPYDSQNHSMLRFYIDAFGMTPILIQQALDRMVAGETLDPPPNVEPSYFSFPKRADYEEYRRQGHVIARLRDLFYRNHSL